jgi:hypothetical protein
MFDVIVSTVSSGRVERWPCDTRAAAEAMAARCEEVAARWKVGLCSIRVEVVRRPRNGSAA